MYPEEVIDIISQASRNESHCMSSIGSERFNQLAIDVIIWYPQVVCKEIVLSVSQTHNHAKTILPENGSAQYNSIYSAYGCDSAKISLIWQGCGRGNAACPERSSRIIVISVSQDIVSMYQESHEGIWVSSQLFVDEKMSSSIELSNNSSPISSSVMSNHDPKVSPVNEGVDWGITSRFSYILLAIISGSFCK